MTSAPRRRLATRSVVLDRALESLPLFRLSDYADDAPITFAPEAGGRWRVIPVAGDRLPGTFDQDVYVEIFRRFHDAGAPEDGTIGFTLHDFLRSMGRRVDGRTYEQLRAALGRLLRTNLESTGAYFDAATGSAHATRFSVLSSTNIDRRRDADREQLGLFSLLAVHEPGEARVTIAAPVRANIAAGLVATRRDHDRRRVARARRLTGRERGCHPCNARCGARVHGSRRVRMNIRTRSTGE